MENLGSDAVYFFSQQSLNWKSLIPTSDLTCGQEKNVTNSFCGENKYKLYETIVSRFDSKLFLNKSLASNILKESTLVEVKTGKKDMWPFSNMWGQTFWSNKKSTWTISMSFILSNFWEKNSQQFQGRQFSLKTKQIVPTYPDGISWEANVWP